MDFSDQYEERSDEIISLFRASFTASEGAAEGDVIAELVTKMLAATPPNDIFVFCAGGAGALAGTVVFSRMLYPQDDRTVFILSPMAVAPDQQGKGIGQALITHGLTRLAAQGVDVVLTYGDINFYAKLGFAQIAEEIARAPLPLQYPQGWLGQSLGDAPLAPLKGPSTCVDALNDPALW